jgi:hypothetical protein
MSATTTDPHGAAQVLVSGAPLLPRWHLLPQMLTAHVGCTVSALESGPAPGSGCPESQKPEAQFAYNELSIVS